MKEQRFTMYCEQQPPSTEQPDVIIWRQPTPPSNPPDPNPPLEPTKKMVDRPKKQTQW